MGQTPDRFPGEADEEGTIYSVNAVDPPTVGEVRYNGSAFRMRDSVGVFDPRNAGSGISATQHAALRQLIHFIEDGGPAETFASGAFYEMLPVGPFPTSYIWWESAALLKKIVEETVVYNGNKTIATDQWKIYDTDGVTVLTTVTDTMTYTGVFEASRTRTIV